MSDWKNDFGPFESEKEKYLFWRFLLKKVKHLNDPETIDKLNFAFVDWRRRQEDETGVMANMEREAREISKVREAKASQSTPPSNIATFGESPVVGADEPIELQ